MTDKILYIPPNGYAPSNEAIAHTLRRLAGQIEYGDRGELSTVVMLLDEKDGALTRITCGHTIDLARVCGLLAIGLSRAASGDEE